MKVHASRVVICLVLGFAGCRDEAVRTTLVQTPPRIDGVLSEWQNVPVRVFEERKIAIGALQDARNLYIAARCADQEINRSLSRRGITMWIDPEAGDRKDLELHEPASGYAVPDPTRGGFWYAMSDSQRERAFKHLGGMRNGVLVIDRRAIESRIFPPDSSEGFAAASAEAQGILTFEIRIPLDPGQFFPGYTSFADKKKIRVGFALGGTQGSGFSNGGPEGGPMGYPGGGRFGGRSRGGLQRRPSSSGSDLWVDVILTK